MARADEKDLEAGLRLLSLLDTLSSGYYPSDSDDAENDPLYLDDEDPVHLAQLWRRLKACIDAAPGFQGRVIGGAHTLMAPGNELIDPADDCLSLHPRLVTALDDAKRLEWLLPRLSGRDLRDAGVVYAAGDTGSMRAAIDAAMQLPTTVLA